MPDYKQSKIYTITYKNYIYIGSTTLLLKYRFILHQTQKTCSMYKYINENYDGNWNKWKINLYENYPCNSKKELSKREGEIIRYFKNDIIYNVINKRVEGRTTKEWINDNKEKYTKYTKQYNNNRKDIRKQRDRIKIECECGCLICKGDLARHKKTKIHQDLIEKQISAILFFLECFYK
jgi:hypothetical protein